MNRDKSQKQETSAKFAEYFVNLLNEYSKTSDLLTISLGTNTCFAGTISSDDVLKSKVNDIAAAQSDINNQANNFIKLFCKSGTTTSSVNTTNCPSTDTNVLQGINLYNQYLQNLSTTPTTTSTSTAPGGTVVTTYKGLPACTSLCNAANLSSSLIPDSTLKNWTCTCPTNTYPTRASSIAGDPVTFVKCVNLPTINYLTVDTSGSGTKCQPQSLSMPPGLTDMDIYTATNTGNLQTINGPNGIITSGGTSYYSISWTIGDPSIGDPYGIIPPGVYSIKIDSTVSSIQIYLYPNEYVYFMLYRNNTNTWTCDSCSPCNPVRSTNITLDPTNTNNSFDNALATTFKNDTSNGLCALDLNTTTPFSRKITINTSSITVGGTPLSIGVKLYSNSANSSLPDNTIYNFSISK